MKNTIKDQYVFITNKDENMQCIGIRKGKFEGVVYRYGKIALGEETWDGNLPFRFEYDIVDPNGLLRETFDDEEFFTLIGDILVDILDEQLKEDNLDHADN